MGTHRVIIPFIDRNTYTHIYVHIHSFHGNQNCANHKFFSFLCWKSLKCISSILALQMNIFVILEFKMCQNTALPLVPIYVFSMVKIFVTHCIKSINRYLWMVRKGRGKFIFTHNINSMGTFHRICLHDQI